MAVSGPLSSSIRPTNNARNTSLRKPLCPIGFPSKKKLRSTGVGTTGTLTGVARFLRERLPNLISVAAEPQGSILGGGAQGPHQVEGIGLSFFPSILDRSVIDEVQLVSDAEAFETCRALAREEGLLVGGSSGVAAAAALRVARRLGPGRTVVTVFPDGAERYPDQGIFQPPG